MTLNDINLEALKRLPFCVFIKDDSYRYQWANDFFLSTAAGLGSVQELKGLRDSQLPWQEYADEVKRNDMRLITSNMGIRVEENVQRFDGSVYKLISHKEQGKIMSALKNII